MLQDNAALDGYRSYLPNNLWQIQWQQVPTAIYDKCPVYVKTHTWIELLKDYLLFLLFYKIIKKVLYELKWYGIIGSASRIYRTCIAGVFRWLLNTTILKSSVEKELKKVTIAMERELIKNDESLADYETIPLKGLSEEEILEELDKLDTIIPHTEWKEGKVSGAVYHGGDELIHLQSEAFEKYCVANQLHPDVFPAVRKMEAEVVSMVLNMFHAPADAGCATTSSGGTESLLLACLSAKMYAYHERGIIKPEMIVPVTAHAGFEKASYYFGIKIHHVEVDPNTYQVNLKKVKSFINRNTVLLVGSAPNFPHGIVDDIVGLGNLATRYNIPLHVDCCLGSFIVAFMQKAGFNDLPPFDFRVPGVTSISCDTHKYGFAPKGSSIIMYRNSDLRKHQYYVSTDWTGGLYGSPTLAGSRPGALVVGCWATMVHIGEAGYIDSCRSIINAARKLKNCIMQEVPDLEIIGDPVCSVIAFTSHTIDMYELGDRLAKEGWHLSALQKPPALHLAVTKLSVNSVDQLITLLKDITKELRDDPNSKPSSDGTSALYGVAGSVKSTGIADKIVVGFLDTLYKLKPSE
ncbi:hypothetical protein HG535_0A04280 [Zygotorulaspora mrakii]|uniref:sphinganine-1-phosphate aldolase n=1 Tax=Zygotorulaspora mrakii TaxID=42260 RepID=A0A7H9AVU5_ZYGMR|nr:uncharacterized protein HG535_0A04280 [Zygotorulaspora mrakii]QLG70488.1 hypothetical protein HG535_0A04280 [Zygotorulaspora mrakii]